MTKIKLCGLSRQQDIAAANALMPEYVGFVFAAKSRRFVRPDAAARLKALLAPSIAAVGVFVDETPEVVAALLNCGKIDLAQLHGHEDERYLTRLRALTGKPLIQAFQLRGMQDVARAAQSSADYILLDSGAGTGRSFDWRWLAALRRPYFLAGGLTPENAALAVQTLRPYALDVSSGIETDGKKDEKKMAAFVRAARKADTL